MIITNRTDVPLPVCVWAVNDNYDHVEDPSYFSVTQLLKPVRQIVLQRRVDYQTLTSDIDDFLARAIGNSIHDSIEKAWVFNYKKCLEQLGFSQNLIDKYKINPQEGELKEGDIPIYLEKRTVREMNGYKIGGKFDFVANGLLHDNKSTTTMKWLKSSSDKDYQLQGSLYRWLNQDIIKDDFIRINYVFTDWSKLSAIKDPKYPQSRAAYKDIPLLSVEETEKWLSNKLDTVKKCLDMDEKDLPKCTDEELWRTPTVYKYYSNPAATRATKNFDSYTEGYKYWQFDKKGIGVLRTVVGEPRRCAYCSASSMCSQYKEMCGGTN